MHSGRYSYSSLFILTCTSCLKRFRRKKPLLVGKLAVVCMQIALASRRQNKRVGNYVVIKFMQRITSWGLGWGHCPSPEIFFDFESENGDV